MLALDKDRAIQPLVRTPFLERNGEVSPDGRWLSYESNDSGEFEIFVRPFPDVNAGKWPVSTGGGTQPLWARNGQELFYVAPDGALMSVPVGRGALWTAGTPTRLIDGQYYRGAGIQHIADIRCVAGWEAVSDDQARRRVRTTTSAVHHRRRPELDRGAEASRADEVTVQTDGIPVNRFDSRRARRIVQTIGIGYHQRLCHALRQLWIW